MNVETTLIEMMRNLHDPQPPNEAQWNRFARRAHRSLWGRRAAAIGTVGMTAFVGSSLADSEVFKTSPISPAGNQSGEQNTSENKHEPDDKNPEPIVVIIEREPGEGHVLYPGTVVMGTADPDGARLYYRLFGADDDVLSEGRIRMGRCIGSDCRRAFSKTIRFEIDKKERGRLEVYLLKPGQVPARVQLSLTLKPG